jgi:hypothetical protein
MEALFFLVPGSVADYSGSLYFWTAIKLSGSNESQGLYTFDGHADHWRRAGLTTSK